MEHPRTGTDPGNQDPAGLELIGRAAYREAIDGLLDAARGGLSKAIVVSGAPGMGKTALLSYAARRATDFTHLHVSGVESEASFSFAGIHRLLLPVLDRLPSLPTPQQDALSGAFGLSSGGDADRFLLRLAVLTMMADVARERPLLCTADDLQWMDQESVEALTFVGRRLFADGIALVLAVRSPADWGTLIDGLETLELEGLSPQESLLVLERTGSGPVDAAVAARIATETEGCPLALVELAAELTADQLAGASRLPEPLPVGHSLEAFFTQRVRSLPDDAQTLLLIVACEPSADDHLLLAAAHTLDVPAAAADEAVQAGLLDRRPTLGFRHPLIRSAVYRGAPPGARRRAHAALAGAMGSADARHQRAWHLAEASIQPDEDVAGQLEHAAAVARERGGYGAVATYLERAAELTPGPAERAQRFLDAAQAALTAGAPRRAGPLLERARPEALTPLLRARAARLRADVDLWAQPGNDAAALLAAARLSEGLDDRLARDTYTEALQAALISGQLTVGTTLLEVAQTALDAPRPAEESATVGDLLLDAIATRVAVGFTAAAPLLRRAVHALSSGDLEATGRTLRSVLGYKAALEIWDIDGYRTLLERFEKTERARGELDSLRVTLRGLCRREIWAGRFTTARAYHAEFVGIAVAIDGPGPIARTFELLDIDLLAWEGRDAETRAAARRLRRGTGGILNAVGLAVGILELAQSRHQQALENLWPVFVADVPSDGNEALAEVVEAGCGCGDRDAAAAALERLEERATVAGTPWALGLLARSRALMATQDDAEAYYRDAIRWLQHADIVTEMARAHLLYGEWLRGQGRKEAREELGTAYAAFVNMGATAFADRAGSGLAAMGGRTRARSVGPADPALTPQEFQIAQLAAAGSTNGEIAAQLFISANTVDYHLRKVFRKLGVTSRRGLRDGLETPSARAST
jgi:DNA-binding CsgD family transcriptional regulator